MIGGTEKTISSSKNEMIVKVVNRKNMLKAYRQVVSNQGSAGVDGMSVKELSHHLKVNRDKIVTAVCHGRYLPQFILGVAILGTVAQGTNQELSKQGYPVENAYEQWDGYSAFLMMAAVVFVIAQIFKKGLELQAENDLTV